MQWIKDRLPGFQEIIPVYAVSASLLFGWMLVLFAWNLPSWMKFMSLGQLFSVLSYSVVVTLLQSLIFMGLILLLCFMLPGAVLKRDFVIRGTLAGIVFLGLIFLRAYLKTAAPWFFSSLGLWALSGVALLVALAWLSSRMAWLRGAVVSLAERFIVFLYLLLPLSAISILVVLMRNLI